MKIESPGLVLLSMMLQACSSGGIGNVKMEDTLNGYGSVIRFREFEKAADYQSPAVKTPLDKAWLKKIHISSYNPIYRKKHDASEIVEQTVEIRYFNEDVGVEEMLTDHQVWRYYKEPDQWMLETDLPNFK